MKVSRTFRVTALVAIILWTAQCGEEKKKKKKISEKPEVSEEVDPLVEDYKLTDEEKIFWLNKASRSITGKDWPSDKVSEGDLEKSRVETIDELMKDEEFANRVLDFNLYFLGLKPNSIKTSRGTLDPDLISAPNAITSARDLYSGRGYFSLFDLNHPHYLDVYSTDEDYEQVLDQAMIHAKDIVESIVSYTSQTTTFQKAVFCSEDQPIAERSFEIFTEFPVSNYLDETFGFITSEPAQYCSGTTTTPFDGATWAGKVLPKLDALDKALRNVNPGSVTSVMDFPILDASAKELKPNSMLNLRFFLNLPNSSTNYNRRRASYILKRYFCDDLTPINVVAPQSHAEDKHASDPSCQSCHYKLDPMAGFFRERGGAGFDFSQAMEIVLDDQTTIDHDVYVGHWRSGSPDREWEVGYIRSATDESMNSYGSTLEDLFKIIRSSREVKQCLVKRMFSYLVSEKQTMDSGYLNYLTDQLETEAKEDEAKAVKNTMTRILLSKSYSQNSVKSNQCYDYAPGEIAGNRPPCEVAAIFERHCTSCHNAKNASGGLNLAEWSAVGGGEPSFPHKKANAQVSKDDTLASILERITTTNKDKRMPLNIFISSADNEALFRWLTKNLQESKTEGEER
ncbi:MAG: hypothetical protein AB7T49_18155 [Oligoflexales bacterium]